MATKTKKANPETRENNITEIISAAYIDFVLTKGKRPASIFEFTKKTHARFPGMLCFGYIHLIHG